jgi:signal peptidase I
MGLKRIEKRQWINFGIWAVLYVLFTAWMENWWLLLGLVVLIDIYLTKLVPWGGWKKSSNPKVQNVLNWVDDILFALIAVYMINIFVFQNYQIPSSSLEKTLLVGDYLFVSKLSFGPRVPNTPVAFPLVQNTLPVLNCKSYLEWPDWGYKRVKGLGRVRRDDIVVFNFPAGDTVMLNMPNPDYYSMVAAVGREAIRLNRHNYGDVVYRPVDKRENYVKRCVGMPGDSLRIIDNQVYIDGKVLENRKNVQFVYYVETDGTKIRDDMFRRLKVSADDQMLVSEPAQEVGYYYQALPYLGFTKNAGGYYNPVYRLPLTAEALEMVRKMPSVRKVIIEPDRIGGDVYPVDYDMGWTRDNYGPIWIPAKGKTIRLDEKNLALYHRCIRNYENNRLEIGADGSVRINGATATTYTFKYDYYWMMGDNRHCSADSRSWGFVPEDHIVGKPILIWLSLDKDRNLFNGGIRWNRMFRRVEAFN